MLSQKQKSLLIFYNEYFYMYTQKAYARCYYKYSIKRKPYITVHVNQYWNRYLKVCKSIQLIPAAPFK